MVDIHTFVPRELEELGRRVGRRRRAGAHGGTDRVLVRLAGAHLRVRGAARRSWGCGWANFALKGWQRLSALDRRLEGIVPRGLFYNAEITGVKP